MLSCTILGGVCALVWLVLRSGSKPSRVTYPCQQAALGTTAAVFGAPLVAIAVRVRPRIIAWMRVRPLTTAMVALLPCALIVGSVLSLSPEPEIDFLDPPNDYRAEIFLVNVNENRRIEPGRYGGVDDLITLMGLNGSKWHRSSHSTLTAGPNGMIDLDDVVLIKVNAQWGQRGGTNTDVLRGVIRKIVEHPDGFVGEIIVADNGQGQGSLNRTDSNAENHHQSPQDVVNDFVDEGWGASTYLWDAITHTRVSEYSAGDMTSGYVVSATRDPETQIKVSYPKFQSASGTYISYKHGLWSPATQAYDSDRLVVINIPVFKTHFTYAITAGVKNHMGVVARDLGTDSHMGVGRGGLGSVLAEVRIPDLTILDCIWILARPGFGPSASYAAASRRDQLVAGTDPVALDIWATKFIMIPQIIENGYDYSSYGSTQDPDNPDSTFRRYMDRSMNELLLAGIDTTNDLGAVQLHVWTGDTDDDGDVDLDDFGRLHECMTGPGGGGQRSCRDADLDGDGDVDLTDFGAFQLSFTGTL